MSASNLKRRLSPMDAFFLYLESETQPMTVGCVAQFEGKISFRRFVSHIESRLHLIPRYLQRVVPAPLNIGMPTWEYDPDFDIRNHVKRVKCDPPGDEDALRRVAERLFTGMQDRDRPLWEIWIVDGMKGNRSGLVTRIHHCMVDGIAGVALMYIIFDAWPKPEKVKKQKVVAPELPSTPELIYDALWDNAIESLEHWTRFQKGLSDYAQGLTSSEVAEAFKEFATTMRDFLAPSARMPFNKPFSGERRFAFADFSFAEARAIRAACGGTLNDVALTVLSGACQRYALAHGEKLRKRYLRVLVPVNIRTEDERGAMGNRISFLPLEIPMEVKDHLERLRIINETTQELKKSKVSEAVSLMFAALQGMPAPLQALSLSSAANSWVQRALGYAWQVPPMHLICTNVPGPQIPLYCVGKRMLNYYPLLPIALEMGVSCGVTSYNQRLYISFIADANAAPDIDLLRDYMRECFDELRAAAEVKERHVVELAHAMRVHELETAAMKANGKRNGSGRSSKERSVAPKSAAVESVAIDAAQAEPARSN